MTVLDKNVHELAEILIKYDNKIAVEMVFDRYTISNQILVYFISSTGPITNSILRTSESKMYNGGLNIFQVSMVDLLLFYDENDRKFPSPFIDDELINLNQLIDYLESKKFENYAKLYAGEKWEERTDKAWKAMTRFSYMISEQIRNGH